MQASGFQLFAVQVCIHENECIILIRINWNEWLATTRSLTNENKRETRGKLT